MLLPVNSIWCSWFLSPWKAFFNLASRIPLCTDLPPPLLLFLPAWYSDSSSSLQPFKTRRTPEALCTYSTDFPKGPLTCSCALIQFGGFKHHLPVGESQNESPLTRLLLHALDISLPFYPAPSLTYLIFNSIWYLYNRDPDIHLPASVSPSSFPISTFCHCTYQNTESHLWLLSFALAPHSISKPHWLYFYHIYLESGSL